MRQIFCIVFLYVVYFLIIGSVQAADSIQLGTFQPISPTPTTLVIHASITPTFAPNVPTPTRKPRPENTQAPNPTPAPRDPCQYIWPPNDAMEKGWAKRAVAQYSNWTYPLNSEQEAFTEAQVWEFNDKVSRKLFNPAWLYSKGIIRLSIAQGFGLDKKDELYETMATLSCLEKTHKIASYLVSPLFFYPLSDMQVTLQLPSSVKTPHGSYGNIDEKATFEFHVDKQGLISFHSGETIPYFSYDNPQIHAIGKPRIGRILSYYSLSDDLSNIAQDTGLNEKEVSVFRDYFKVRLPKANYYIATLLDNHIAEKFMPWNIDPAPDTQIRLLFAFQPLLKEPENISRQEFPGLKREGFTVLDFAGIILY